MDSDIKLKDELTQKIGVLTRRETEARIIAPFVDALIKTFGKEKITPILEKTVSLELITPSDLPAAFESSNLRAPKLVPAWALLYTKFSEKILSFIDRGRLPFFLLYSLIIDVILSNLTLISIVIFDILK